MRKLNLSTFSFRQEFGERLAVGVCVQGSWTELALQFCDEVVQNLVIKVFPAKEIIPGMIDDPEPAFNAPNQRRIECASTQVVHQKEPVQAFSLETISQGRRDGFLQERRASDAGVLRCPPRGIALRDLKHGRDGNDCRSYFFAGFPQHVLPQTLEDL